MPSESGYINGGMFQRSAGEPRGPVITVRRPGHRRRTGRYRATRRRDRRQEDAGCGDGVSRLLP